MIRSSFRVNIRADAGNITEVARVSATVVCRLGASSNRPSPSWVFRFRTQRNHIGRLRRTGWHPSALRSPILQMSSSSAAESQEQVLRERYSNSIHVSKSSFSRRGPYVAAQLVEMVGISSQVLPRPGKTLANEKHRTIIGRIGWRNTVLKKRF